MKYRDGIIAGIDIASHPSWVRGLKSIDGLAEAVNETVAPLVGAWIEIFEESSLAIFNIVAPLVGAWIEININDLYGIIKGIVAPLVGAWIEIGSCCP